MTSLEYWSALNSATKILTASDFHLNPNDALTKPQRAFLELGQEPGTRIVINGDFLNLIIWGPDAYWHSPVLSDIKKHIPPWGLDLIVGNHTARQSWLQSLFVDQQIQVRVARSLDLKIEGQKWHFEHGDRFSVDWGFFRWLYSWSAETAAGINRGAWLKFCRHNGWIPSELKKAKRNSPSSSRESEKYSRATLLTWARALDWAARHQTNLAIGHTHRGMVWTTPWLTLADSGDMETDNTYNEITAKGAELKPEADLEVPHASAS